MFCCCCIKSIPFSLIGSTSGQFVLVVDGVEQCWINANLQIVASKIRGGMKFHKPIVTPVPNDFDQKTNFDSVIMHQSFPKTTNDTANEWNYQLSQPDKKHSSRYDHSSNGISAPVFTLILQFCITTCRTSSWFPSILYSTHNFSHFCNTCVVFVCLFGV